MFGSIQISPSLLSADFMNMRESVQMIEQAGASLIHVDVMDGHFVPNLTIGMPFVKQLKAIAALPLDVHLMIDNPLVQLPWFLDAGADLVTVHLEAFNREKDEVSQAVKMIRGAGARVGLAIKPTTLVHDLEAFISKVDMVLIMSVNPGFSGQSYIEGSDVRVAEVVHMARREGVSPLIQVDGGMDIKTVELAAAAGADVVVAGNAVFAAEKPAEAIATLIRVAAVAQKRGTANRGFYD